MANDSASRVDRVRGSIGGTIAGSLARPRAVVSLLLSLSLTACSTLDKAGSKVSETLFGGGTQPGQQGYVEGFIGGAVADEPRAALLGREVLSAGGTAADAVSAMGFALSVTYASRAGLGGGGACIAYAASKTSVNGGIPDAILFPSVAPAGGSAGGDRPAAVPMMARGLFLLHTRYGKLPFEGLVARAEQLARQGVPASRAFVRDLSLVHGPLLTDPGARAAFSRNGVPLTEGQTMVQPDLAATLAQIRLAGVGDLYQGVLARRLEEGSRSAGGPLTVSDLRGAVPRVAGALITAYGPDKVAFLPPPADGGLAAAAGFSVLTRNANDLGGATARGLAAAARWRAGGASAEQILQTADLPAAGLPALPASTSFGAVDRDGNAVMCAVTMGNLFGTGRVVPGMGFLLGASPAVAPQPLLAAGLVWNDAEHAFRAAAGGSGQAGAPMAVATGLMNALRTGQPMAGVVAEPGRANVMSCARYLPGKAESCGFAADPRESGFAATGG